MGTDHGFAPYVSLSRCSDWSKVHIATFHTSAFITDKLMIEEYKRLDFGTDGFYSSAIMNGKNGKNF